MTDIASLTIALVALVVALLALRRSDKNTSAATLVTLNEAFTAAWQRYLAPKAKRDFEFGNLANLLEIGCAFHHEGSIHGASKEILGHYLESILGMIEELPDARKRLQALREDPDNFKYIIRFLTKRRTRAARDVATTGFSEGRIGED